MCQIDYINFFSLLNPFNYHTEKNSGEKSSLASKPTIVKVGLVSLPSFLLITGAITAGLLMPPTLVISAPMIALAIPICTLAWSISMISTRILFKKCFSKLV